MVSSKLLFNSFQLSYIKETQNYPSLTILVSQSLSEIHCSWFCVYDLYYHDLFCTVSGSTAKPRQHITAVV